MNIIGDIGNTEVKLCQVSKNNNVKKKIILKTHLIDNKYLKKKLSIFFKKNKVKNNIYFSSVVPKVFNLIKFYLYKNFKIICIEIKMLNLNKLIKIDVNRKQVGSDRLCNAIGVNDYKNNYIIVDFGTATTFDVVIKNNYLGGIISPGVNLSLNTLVSKASMIPKIKLKSISKVLGKNTLEAVRSGFYWGYLGLIESMIRKISKKTKKKYKIIFTGGLSHLFKKTISFKISINRNLTINGLLKVVQLIK